MKEKDRLNMVLRGGGRFKSFLASILFIFFLIPHILDARTVHRRAYMVCPGGEAYWDANRQQSVCCLGRVKQKIDGSYICNCSSNSDCPENHICMKDGTCRGCVEGYTTYCSVFEGEACIEAGCSTVEDCVQKRLGDLGQCCAESAEVYYSSYDANGNGITLSCCTGTSEIKTLEDGFQTCCNSAYITPYCLSYSANGKCISATCSSSNCIPYRKSAREGGCCNLSISWYSLQDIPDSEYQMCCMSSSGTTTAYCKQYNTDGSCATGACMASNCTPYRKSETEGDCCSKSSQVMTVEGYPYELCCTSGRKAYCSAWLGDVCISAQCCDSNGAGNEICCTGNHTCFGMDENGNVNSCRCCTNDQKPYAYATKESSSVNTVGDDYATLCCSQIVKSVGDGLSACCAEKRDAYCSEYNDNYQCINTSCCWGDNEQRYRKNYSTDACCLSSYYVIDYKDGLQGCCSDPKAKPYCVEVDSHGRCMETKCCLGTVEALSGGLETCIISGQCGTGYTYYHSTPDHEGCCLTSSDVSLGFGETIKYLSAAENGLQACCSAEETGYCSERDRNGSCLNMSCCSNSNALSIRLGRCCSVGETPYCSSNYEGTNICEYTGCCSSDKKIWTIDNVSACCNEGEIGYCSSYLNGQCVSMSCSSDCTPYRLTETSGGCCRGETMALANGTEHCCSAGQQIYCTAYDDNDRCTAASCSSSACTPYRNKTNSGACCSSSYKLFNGDNELKACCSSSAILSYCSSYNADGSCAQLSCSSNSCTPYRYSDANGGCCTSKLQTVDGFKYQVCCNGVAYCTSYSSLGECTNNSCSSSTCTPYRSSQTSGSCCSSSSVVPEKSFDGVQACVSPDYTTVYCSSYVNGLCNRVSASYISGGCTPYRKSATEGGCCSGSVIKSGDYEICI